MVSDRERDIIDKAIGDEPPDDSQAICANCNETREEHSQWVIRPAHQSLHRVVTVCYPLDELIGGNTFEELTDDDIASMRADEEYSRRKDEGLL